MTLAAKLAQRYCHDFNFPIFPMAMKMRQTVLQIGWLTKNESIAFMIIVCFSFMIYWYLLYSSFIRTIYCDK